MSELDNVNGKCGNTGNGEHKNIEIFIYEQTKPDKKNISWGTMEILWKFLYNSPVNKNG
jgi:hypothetical protein